VSENLFKAIHAKFIAAPANAFYTDTGGRLEYGKAPESWSDNFAVMQALSIEPDDVFGGIIEDVYFQISVFSSVRATCWSLIDKCKSLFNNTTLTVTGHYPATLHRETQTPPMWDEKANIYQATIDFTCKIQPSS
jgi:hypothetical protein